LRLEGNFVFPFAKYLPSPFFSLIESVFSRHHKDREHLPFPFFFPQGFAGQIPPSLREPVVVFSVVQRHFSLPPAPSPPFYEPDFLLAPVPLSVNRGSLYASCFPLFVSCRRFWPSVAVFFFEKAPNLFPWIWSLHRSPAIHFFFSFLSFALTSFSKGGHVTPRSLAKAGSNTVRFSWSVGKPHFFLLACGRS